MTSKANTEARPELPASDNTVNVSIINTTSKIVAPMKAFVEPVLPGLETIEVPAYSFLVRNEKLNRTVVFDLGVRKDWQNLAPGLVARLTSFGFKMEVEKDVREILEENGADVAGIEAVIWSHSHFDHTGDPSRFDKHTKLVVGPGFKQNLMPGYPSNENSGVLDADWAGRDMEEITFDGAADQHQLLRIGQFPAIDYFGDGSFYLLDAPGHCLAHMCALARVTSKPDSFVLLGADSVHHGGELRPSPWTPLPDHIDPDPLHSHGLCPGDLAARLLQDADCTKTFFEPAQRGSHHNPAQAKETITKLQELDALDNVLVTVAHDPTVLDVVDFYPKSANDFVSKGWKKQLQWAFLKDFVPAAKEAASSSS